ncbi:NAD(P)H-hydrate epimerase [Aminipila butyrica]|uniref:NAD(P)H-hydrate epimerase n=1 Tax=Aminipila butyrica TaxID=433296 RepID=A0A858BT73_9FIRM|nr:NAD(P)H-hydrate epimerase [Aminipila butyrica]QIB69201.1 NAD(P)H-hydrate epimerase [Aminipila butyrica]
MDCLQQEPVTCEQMKEIEHRANDGGLSYDKMMENAGLEAASIIWQLLFPEVEGEIQEEKTTICGTNRQGDVVIFCGKGNNGGDGWVVARELAARGLFVTVVLAEGNPKTETAIGKANVVLRRGIPVIDAKAYLGELREILEAADLVVDAMYGTGFHGQLPETVRACARLINSTCSRESLISKQVFSLDIPTGLNGDLGQPDRDTVRADYTVAFHRTKPVHHLKEAMPYCGKVLVAGIGID